MTLQIYLVTLWRGPTPRLGTTGLNDPAVHKVGKTCSTSTATAVKCCLDTDASVLISHKGHFSAEHVLLPLILSVHSANLYFFKHNFE